jgi:peptidyl-prolyl cis-trans isomerase SurA
MRRLILAVAALVLAAPAADAQEVQWIAAVVNDEVVSVYDLEQRLKLALASANLEDTVDNRLRFRDRILDRLIDERLQWQEAQRRSITVSEAAIAAEMRLIEQQNGLPEGGLDDVLRANGVDKSVLTDQLQTQIGWRTLLMSRIRPTIYIGDDEIDAVIERMRASAGQRESFVLEIFLAVDEAGREAAVARTADGLVARLRDGAPFQAIARQFSQSSTAVAGGTLGWVEEGQLIPKLDTALADLEIGEVSDPIATPAGYYVLKLGDRRDFMRASAGETSFRLKQVVLRLAPEASGDEAARTLQQAREIAAQIAGCDSVDAIAERLGGPGSGDLGMVLRRDLPPEIGAAVNALDVGVASAPVRTANGVHVLIVCERVEPEETGPDRNAILESLGLTRLTMQARRYLRDLQRESVVDRRLRDSERG